MNTIKIGIRKMRNNEILFGKFNCLTPFSKKTGPALIGQGDY